MANIHFPPITSSLAAVVLALVSCLLLSASSQANEYPPSVDFRPCDPTAARCDIELEIVNDRGIPQEAYPVLQADVDNPDFYRQSQAAPLNYFTTRGTLAFNLSAGRFHKMHCRPSTQSIDCFWRGPYRFPLPPEANNTPGNGWRIENYPLSVGSELRIGRNAYLEGAMSGRELFPEKTGVSWTIPSAIPYRGKIVLPSFGTPRQPQLTRRERGALGVLNDLRAERGATRLVAQPDLNAAADNYACWLASKEGEKWQHLYAHHRFGTPAQRAVDAGWPSGAAETIFFGPPEAGLQWLLNSPPHRKILLSSEKVWVGVAYGCGNLIMTPTTDHRRYPGQPEPFGGWGDDVGDSSLANWDDQEGDWDDENNFSPQRRFRARIKIKPQRQMAIVKISRRAHGKLIVRSGKRVRHTKRSKIRIPFSARRPLVIVFRASANSLVASGKIKRCFRPRVDKFRACRR